MKSLFTRIRRRSPSVASDACFTVDAAVRLTPATDDGRVVLNTRTARVWVLNRTGADIWDRFSAGEPIARIAADLSLRYERPASAVQHDLIAFARTLMDAGLLRVDGRAS